MRRRTGRNPSAAVRAIAADPHYQNVTVSVEKVAELKLPEKLDMVWTSQNYHDVHNVKDIDVGAFNKAIFDSLKPGGIYIVIDHATEKGAGFTVTSTLHRSDPDAVKTEVMAAGFNSSAPATSSPIRPTTTRRPSSTRACTTRRTATS